MNWDPTIALIVAAIGLVLLGLVYWFGRPRRPEQGRRLFGDKPAARREPSLDGQGDPDAAAIERELAALERTLGGEPAPTATAPEAAKSAPGAREGGDFDKIISLFVAAREGGMIRGADLVVAAEKAGLTFGAMNIFHRLVDGRPEQGPIFSVANMLKPGNFDLRELEQVATPGLSFFMTLPGPLPGLDAWDTMLPAAQRMAELLDAVVLDEKRNALGRQRIAHIRDELRAYDRKREGQVIRAAW